MYKKDVVNSCVLVGNLRHNTCSPAVQINRITNSDTNLLIPGRFCEKMMLPGFEMCCTRPVEYSSIHARGTYPWMCESICGSHFPWITSTIDGFLPIDKRFDMSRSRYFLVLDLGPRDLRFQVSHS